MKGAPQPGEVRRLTRAEAQRSGLPESLFILNTGHQIIFLRKKAGKFYNVVSLREMAEGGDKVGSDFLHLYWRRKL